MATGDSEYTHRLRCKLRDLQRDHDAIVSRMAGIQEAIDISEQVDVKPVSPVVHSLRDVSNLDKYPG